MSTDTTPATSSNVVDLPPIPVDNKHEEKQASAKKPSTAKKPAINLSSKKPAAKKAAPKKSPSKPAVKAKTSSSKPAAKKASPVKKIAAAAKKVGEKLKRVAGTKAQTQVPLHLFGYAKYRAKQEGVKVAEINRRFYEAGAIKDGYSASKTY